MLLPGHRRLNALLLELEQAAPAGGPPPQLARIEALGKRMAATSVVLHLSLVVILVLMVWKP